MLCPRSYGIVGGNTNVIREAAERYDRERSVSSMWFEAIQAKWSSAHWAAEPSMQDVWSPICPPGCNFTGEAAVLFTLYVALTSARTGGA